METNTLCLYDDKASPKSSVFVNFLQQIEMHKMAQSQGAVKFNQTSSFNLQQLSNNRLSMPYWSCGQRARLLLCDASSNRAKVCSFYPVKVV